MALGPHVLTPIHPVRAWWHWNVTVRLCVWGARPCGVEPHVRGVVDAPWFRVDWSRRLTLGWYD